MYPGGVREGMPLIFCWKVDFVKHPNAYVLSVYFSGPGGEDLEGGYYDAGDNLKVEYDV